MEKDDGDLCPTVPLTEIDLQSPFLVREGFGVTRTHCERLTVTVDLSTIVDNGFISRNIGEMVQIVRTDVYERWVRKLKDRKAVARISVSIRKISLGNFGDVKPVGAGVSEVRIDYGPGYRLYFVQRRSGEIVILLCGGTKQRQGSDISRAKEMAKNL